MSDPAPSENIDLTPGQMHLLKMAAVHVCVQKLLAAPQPTSMPPAFAEVLGQLRILTRDA